MHAISNHLYFVDGGLECRSAIFTKGCEDYSIEAAKYLTTPHLIPAVAASWRVLLHWSSTRLGQRDSPACSPIMSSQVGNRMIDCKQVFPTYKGKHKIAHWVYSIKDQDDFPAEVELLQRIRSKVDLYQVLKSVIPFLKSNLQSTGQKVIF